MLPEDGFWTATCRSSAFRSAEKHHRNRQSQDPNRLRDSFLMVDLQLKKATAYNHITLISRLMGFRDPLKLRMVSSRSSFPST